MAVVKVALEEEEEEEVRSRRRRGRSRRRKEGEGFHQQIALKFKEGTNEILLFEHGFVW
jgi:hypothetical protein